MTQVSLARLTVIAALVFMALRPAHAQGYSGPLPARVGPGPEYKETMDSYAKWVTNGHSCQIIKHFRPGDNQIVIERGTRVFIDSEEIADLEKALHNLKVCNKFYECVGWRDSNRCGKNGKINKVRHDPRRTGRTRHDHPRPPHRDFFAAGRERTGEGDRDATRAYPPRSIFRTAVAVYCLPPPVR
jgi:hypothetical protein